eukprot:scaffold54298_cov24-Tisochrysis_lutea.AAC.1
MRGLPPTPTCKVGCQDAGHDGTHAVWALWVRQQLALLMQLHALIPHQRDALLLLQLFERMGKDGPELSFILHHLVAQHAYHSPTSMAWYSSVSLILKNVLS